LASAFEQLAAHATQLLVAQTGESATATLAATDGRANGTATNVGLDLHWKLLK
jgi:hypothetical protein